MIKKFIDKLLGKASGAKSSKTSKFGKREDVPVSVHGIDRSLVDQRALDVVHTLKQAGFEAYIVGGAVRDLLLGLRPKDFDVATSATPEQVKSLFRRAFIIGRRFRIVHVVYGRGREHEMIEVSTFRAYLDSADAEQVSGNERTSKGELASMKHAVDASGRVLRDNVWGPIEQDAARRDFSINAMYYDPESQVVVDFHNGIRDAKKLTLRMIGDAATRYREDPVRIIRAVRFAAKLSGLGFKFDAKTLAPLASSHKLLADVPQSRLFDEMLKLLQTGHSLASVEQLRAVGLNTGIYPLLDVVVERADDPFVKLALQDTDRRVGENKPVAPSFLLACVLWADVRKGWNQRLQPRGNQRPPPAFGALQDAVDEVFESRIGDVSGRGKLGADMREIWMMQPRFDKRVGTSPFSLVDQARFRAGFDFLRLRAQVGEIEEELAHWWETFQNASDEIREDMVDAQRKVNQPKGGAGGARRVKRSDADHPASATEPDPRFRAAGEADNDEDGDDDNAPAEAGASADGTAPAKKRRRRRRKPGGAGGAAGQGGATEGSGD
ncbi:MAG: poly(A) polymerase [Burkholderiales bacterium RIFCSPHIGHO2_02_FULL_66_10]|jgi:poly(A) polymerase|uniref:polynucleotide adenylyltransferase PcnB n=1 Tax=Hydrogenophaga sp. TaxID=1904254 RepID=UPI0008D61280|nr:polynucleotide adenylyltransferase PcnB [Hydrogenophaga sp.]MBU4182754.1 polynucleotide adenylyltransferase PcnB [Gammaproteobacteria bacterium]MBW8469242.1 polynucleotide adenylyltransferase PcnB [Thiobacillus sp.]OGB21433.1 MAG: poly(A) polymerase [Burkholderiales bacterium RIFCSPHIGHO2_02_FULL_66_10]OGB27940.1 MAG: poly(A) polymerase [Burkholderiales bacterium RIFCSPLOWO2_02_FULL_66_35]MBU4283445.1 polynucleotide adenylyltransferase PcnB [Gammaproteobacteria bacterium]